MVECGNCKTETDGNMYVVKADGENAIPVCCWSCGMAMCSQEDVFYVPGGIYTESGGIKNGNNL